MQKHSSGCIYQNTKIIALVGYVKVNLFLKQCFALPLVDTISSIEDCAKHCLKNECTLASIFSIYNVNFTCIHKKDLHLLTWVDPVSTKYLGVLNSINK